MSSVDPRVMQLLVARRTPAKAEKPKEKAVDPRVIQLLKARRTPRVTNEK